MYKDIDVDLLISLVETRPVIWDKLLNPGASEYAQSSYRSTHLLYPAWNEVCARLNDEFDTMTYQEKHDYCRAVRKKWTNLKDNWVKCNRKIKEYTGDGPKPHLYLYYKQMKFLDKAFDNRKGDTTNEDHAVSDDDEPLQKRTKIEPAEPSFEVMVEEEDYIYDSCSPKARSVQEPTQNPLEGDNRVMSFFKSIAPTVAKFEEDELIEFQFQVVKIVRHIVKNKSTNSVGKTRIDKDDLSD